MKTPALALLTGSLFVLAGCAMPFGTSNVGSASLGGYFPAVKDAMWVYDVTTTVSGTDATPSKTVSAVTIRNVSKTGDVASIVYNNGGFGPLKLTKDKAYMSLNSYGEVIPLPLKKDASWSYKDSEDATESVAVKVVDEPEVTVGAGKFKTMHITYTRKVADKDVIVRETWLADGVGMVKSVFGGTATMSAELNSYHL